MKFRFTYLLLSVAIAGCHVGPQIEDFEQARRPEGITAIIELRGGIAEREHVEGELLEVREDGLLLNTRQVRAGGVVKRHLVFVPYTAMEDVRLEGLNLRVFNGTDPLVEEDSWVGAFLDSVRDSRVAHSSRPNCLLRPMGQFR